MTVASIEMTSFCGHCCVVRRVRRLNREALYVPMTEDGRPIHDADDVDPRRVHALLVCGHNKEFITSRHQLRLSGVAA